MLKKKRKYRRRKVVELKSEVPEPIPGKAVLHSVMPPLEGEGKKDTDMVTREDWDGPPMESEVIEKEETFADKIKTISVNTPPRTFIEVPVTLRVKGQDVVRMRKRHMTKG